MQQGETVRLLLVGDDPALGDLVRAGTPSFDLVQAATHDAARIALSVEPFDCALVCGDPGGADALSFCAHARRTAVSPVALVVALDREDEDIALRAIELGADSALPAGRLDERSLGRILRQAMIRRRREADLEARIRELGELATNDPLTGLLNRRGTEQALRREQMIAVRRTAESHFVLLDVDDFKHVNDQHGYEVGDLVLKEVGRILASTVRRSDHVGRIGGDEFLVLLPGCKLAVALKLAERIRASLATTAVGYAGGRVSVRVSLGVACLPISVTSVTDAVALVSGAVRRSKRRGKNRVTVEMATISGELPTVGMSEGEGQFMAGETLVLVQPIVRLSDGLPVARWVQPVGSLVTTASDRDDALSLSSPAMVPRDLALLEGAVHAVRSSDDAGHLFFGVLPETVRATPPSWFRDLFEALPEDAAPGLMLSDHHVVGDPSTLADAVIALRDLGIGLAYRDARFGTHGLEILALLRPDIVAIPAKLILGTGADASREDLLRRQVRVVRSIGAEVAIEGVVDPSDRALAERLGASLGIGAGVAPVSVRRADG